jgi:hypothetical protein
MIGNLLGDAPTEISDVKLNDNKEFEYLVNFKINLDRHQPLERWYKKKEILKYEFHEIIIDFYE